MNREIKFRFWVKEAYKHDDHEEINYKMIYPHAYKDRWYVLDLQNQVLMEGEAGTISDFPMEVMRFTGLKDKNGKEIYEGDIIFNDMNEWKYSVLWDEPLSAFILNHDESQTWIFLHEMNEDMNCCEVIGNIYENPELLK